MTFSVCVAVSGSFSPNTQFTFQVLVEIWGIFQSMAINNTAINILIYLFDEYICIYDEYIYICSARYSTAQIHHKECLLLIR